MRLLDPEVSRHHAQVRVAVGGGLEIDDLGSRNGTWVNGTRIRSATPLTSGDVVRVGSTSLLVALEDRSTTVTSPAHVPAPEPSSYVPVPEPSAPVFAARPSPRPPVLAVPPTPQPFNAGVRPAAVRRRAAATRRPFLMLLTVAVIVGTALALIAYFAMRR
jgi:hypothetical protein